MRFQIKIIRMFSKSRNTRLFKCREQMVHVYDLTYIRGEVNFVLFFNLLRHKQNIGTL